MKADNFDEFIKAYEEILERKVSDGERAIYLLFFEKGRETGRKDE